MPPPPHRRHSAGIARCARSDSPWESRGCGPVDRRAPRCRARSNPAPAAAPPAPDRPSRPRRGWRCCSRSRHPSHRRHADLVEAEPVAQSAEHLEISRAVPPEAPLVPHADFPQRPRSRVQFQHEFLRRSARRTRGKGMTSTCSIPSASMSRSLCAVAVSKPRRLFRPQDFRRVRVERDHDRGAARRRAHRPAPARARRDGPRCTPSNTPMARKTGPGTRASSGIACRVGQPSIAVRPRAGAKPPAG